MKLTLLIACLILALLTMVSGADTKNPIREGTEWCEFRVFDANATKLPRVLLIGDSITIGYYHEVEKALHGRASLAYMATSAAVGDRVLLDQLQLILGQYRFDVIHFNVGLHGFGYTEAEYRTHLPDVLRVIKSKAPGAHLIWATTTPMRKSWPHVSEFHENNERVKARNQIAAELMAKHEDRD